MEASIPILMFAAISAVMSAGILVTAHLIGPRKRTAVKLMPYESGMDPIHSARQRFNIGYYLLAIEFLVFDVELLVLYPWAIAAHDSRVFGAGHDVFWAVMAFLTVLTVGFIYTWRKGLFKWT